MGILDREYENKVFVWDLYRKLDDGRYALFDQQQDKLDSGELDRHASAFDFDPEKIYVGFIKEIGAFGLLASYYLPKHNKVEFSVYVLRDGYFEELKFPDPTKATGIYHRDDAGNVPGLPDSLKHYLASPVKAKMKVVARRIDSGDAGD